MPKETTIDLVRRVLVEQLGVTPEQVTPDASLHDDLGTDSLDDCELVMAFEEEFNVEIPDEKIENPPVRTVGDIVRLIDKLLPDRP